jgi:hypothetical protein
MTMIYFNSEYFKVMFIYALVIIGIILAIKFLIWLF